MRYEFWRVAYPETIVFESTKDTDGRVADGRNAFYSRAVTFLKIQTGNTETLKNEDIENAAQTATGNFLDFFKSERRKKRWPRKLQLILRLI